MRKIIFFLLGLILILSVIAAYKFSNNLFVRYSYKVAQALVSEEQLNGIDILSLNFKTAKFKFPDTIYWQDVTSRFSINKKSYLSNQDFTLQANRLSLRLADFFQKKFLISASNLTIAPSTSLKGIDTLPLNLNSEGIEKGYFQVKFIFNFFKPGTAKEQVDQLYRKLSHFFHDGKTIIPVDFSGISFFTINNAPVKANIYTKRDMDGFYAIHVNKELFKTIAWYHMYELTDAETQLLSENPFKMHQLIKIMDYAATKSEKFKNIDQIPEDAYRHILWSYLLTKEFGPKFAKRVTDAHEEGDQTNTEAEHKMDFNNNTIGREYALNGYQKDKILTRLLNDPRVIRKPE